MTDHILKSKAEIKREVESRKAKTHVQARYTPLVSPQDDLKSRIIVLSGLPGVGKTEVASALAKALKATHLNADQVRSTVTKHLGFDNLSRIAQADALGNMARWVADSGAYVVVDFVCPTFDTREAFCNAVGDHRGTVTWFELVNPDFTSRFPDTNKIYEPMASSVFLDLLKLNFKQVLNTPDTDVSSLVPELIAFITKFKG